MEVTRIIGKIKSIFHSTGSFNDLRCKIQQPEFITALIIGLTFQDGRTKSISGLRKGIGSLTKIFLSRGAFWERLTSKRLKKALIFILDSLINELKVDFGVGSDILKKLNIKNIHILDSSSFTLNDGANEDFPGPRTNVAPAVLKIHGLLNLFGGSLDWFKTTEGTTHDSQVFPCLSLLKKSLIIFDLGYWDYQLLSNLDENDVKFLSRVKNLATIKVVKVVKNAATSCIGFNLHSGRFNAFRGDIIECIGEIIISKTGKSLTVRTLGFWSRDDHSYHWYTTNLEISSDVIYSLYRLRWQLELFWKSLKSVLHLDELTSENPKIILNLVFAGLIASMLAGTISKSAIADKSKDEQAAFSFQRAISFLLVIANELYIHLMTPLRAGRKKILGIINQFKTELIDPNWRKRETSVKRVHREIFNMS